MTVAELLTFLIQQDQSKEVWIYAQERVLAYEVEKDISGDVVISS